MEPITPEPKKTQVEKNKKSGGLVSLIVLIVLTICFALIAFFGSNQNEFSQMNQSQSKSLDFSFNSFHRNFEKSDNTFVGDYIAKIYITGVIQEANDTYNQEWLLSTINELKDDPANKGIILFLDSPGGTVYESDEVYLALSKYQTSRKPVWTYMTHLAASGGYYIACGTQYICANRNTMTGSIGVIAGQSLDVTELMDKLGIKSKTFTAGRNKNMLNYDSPLTEEQEQIMQEIADECYNQFTTIVAINRRIDKNQVIKLADGRIYTAQQALNNKLIDKICSYDDAIKLMKAQNNLSDVEVIDFQYEPPFSFFNFLTSVFSNLKPLTLSTEEKLLEMVSPNINYPAYLYN